MDADVERALADREVLQEHNYWVTFSCQLEPRAVVLVYGVTHSNGMKERALANVHYYVDLSGIVRVNKSIHT